jgi:hypothetical protein
MTTKPERIEWEGGKYAVELTEGYKMQAFRHGEPWSVKTDNLVGDKFTLTLLYAMQGLVADLATSRGLVKLAREELRGLADSLDDHIIADLDERLTVYNQLVILWRALDHA